MKTADRPVNFDPQGTFLQKRLASELTWTATGTPGVEKKLHVAGNESSMYEVSLLRLAPGSRLPSFREGWGLEVVVLEGAWQLPEGILEQHGYSRRPPGAVGADSTATGCILYVRLAPFAEDDEQVHSQVGDEPWSAGHGNLRVETSTVFPHWRVDLPRGNWDKRTHVEIKCVHYENSSGKHFDPGAPRRIRGQGTQSGP